MGINCCIPDQVNRHDIRDIRKSSWNSGRNGRDGIGRSKVDIRELKAFRDRLDKAAKQTELSAFYEQAAKELAARLLALVIKRTPVGNYQKDNEYKRYKRNNEKKGIKAGDIMYNKNGEARRDKYKKVSFQTASGENVSFMSNTSGKQGGTLRRGWTAKTAEEAASGSGLGTNAKAYADSLQVSYSGGAYQIEVINPVEYASYVEFGHSTRNRKGWVKGRFMLTISEQELEAMAPRILEKKLQKFLEGVVTGSDQ